VIPAAVELAAAAVADAYTLLFSLLTHGFLLSLSLLAPLLVLLLNLLSMVNRLLRLLLVLFLFVTAAAISLR